MSSQPGTRTVQLKPGCWPALVLPPDSACVCAGYHGSGSTSYGAAMAAIFIEGWIFLLLTVTGARAKLITYVPRSIALAMSAGAPHMVASMARGSGSLRAAELQRAGGSRIQVDPLPLPPLPLLLLLPLLLSL